MREETIRTLSRREMVKAAGAGALASALAVDLSTPEGARADSGHTRADSGRTRAEAEEERAEPGKVDGEPHRARAILFDVGGTILDWTVMPEKLTGFFAERGLEVDGEAFWPAWRTKLFFYMMYNTMIDSGFIPLEELGRRVTLAVTGSMEIALDEDDADLVLPMLGELDLHPDVIPGLERMKALGYRLVPHTQLSQSILDRALLPRFDWDWHFTSETFAAYKPERSLYLRAVESLGLDRSDIIYVTSNQFDIFGSKGVGFRAAWVDRWSEPFEPYGYTPDWHVTDFVELADVLEAEDTGE